MTTNNSSDSNLQCSQPVEFEKLCVCDRGGHRAPSGEVVSGVEMLTLFLHQP